MIPYSCVYEITSKCVLPESIKRLILNNMYQFTPKSNRELALAVKEYPSNIERYGSIEFWNVMNISNMSNIFNDKIINFDILRLKKFQNFN